MQKLVVLYMMALSLFAGETIVISQAQQDDLGVRIQAVTDIKSINFGPFSGVVVLDKKDILSISTNMESIVKSIHVRELQHVTKGQKLLTIQSNALHGLQLDFIEAVLEQESSNQNYQRNIKLQADGIISNKRLLESKKIKKSNDLRVNLTQNKLLMSGFTSRMIQKLKKDTNPISQITIYAKKSGVIHSINVNIGENVLSQRKMIELYADGKRFIEMSVPVKSIEHISLGEEVTFDSFKATVTAIGNVVNKGSQSVLVRATIKSEKDIMINRVYQANISKQVEGVFKIKKTTLVFADDKFLVFKKTTSGFETLEVQIIREGPTCYIVKADLNDSDLLAASSTSALLSARDNESE